MQLNNSTGSASDNRCNGGGQRMRPAHAAVALGINKSTLSRYLRTHPELKGPDGQVDLAALRAHRSENVDGLKSYSHLGGDVGFERIDAASTGGAPANGDDQPATAARPRRKPAQAGPSTSTGSATNLTYADAKRRREEAAAQKAELDLADRRGQLVPRQEVEARAADLAQQIRERAGQVVREAAERAAADHGLEPRLVRTALEQAQRDIFAAIADDMTGLVHSEQSDRDTA